MPCSPRARSSICTMPTCFAPNPVQKKFQWNGPIAGSGLGRNRPNRSDGPAVRSHRARWSRRLVVPNQMHTTPWIKRFVSPFRERTGPSGRLPAPAFEEGQAGSAATACAPLERLRIPSRPSGLNPPLQPKDAGAPSCGRPGACSIEGRGALSLGNRSALYRGSRAAPRGW